MVIIHPKLTKFSNKYCQGSVFQRAKIAEKINEKIFGNTVKLYRGKMRNVDMEVIEDCYNFCLPENKEILLKPISFKDLDDYYGGVEILEKLKMYVGYMMDLPVSKSSKLNIKTIPALMHESTHILDYLINPKYLTCDRDLYNIAPGVKNLIMSDKAGNPQSEKVQNIINLYNELFYRIENNKNDKFQILTNAETKLSESLENMDFKTKIIVLKFMRTSMKMEQHAYKQDLHFAKILKKLGKPVDREDLIDYNKIIMFPEKIEIVEKMLLQTICSEREKLRPKPFWKKIISHITEIVQRKSNTNV